MRTVALRALLVVGSLTLACAVGFDGGPACFGGPASMPCAGSPGAGVELSLLLAGAAAAIGAALAIAIGWHAVGHRRVVQALRRTSQPSLLLGHEVALVSGLQAPDLLPA